MKAVIAQVPEHVLQKRRRTGADQWDEMWEGVLHMPPAPNREHQDIEGALEAWLRAHWAEPHGNRVYHQINLAPPQKLEESGAGDAGDWRDNYRIPDLVLLTPDRFGIDRNEYFEGAPTVVVEIHSPGDEAYEKLPFYADLGVPEVWIIDRDTKEPEVHVLGQGEYAKQEPGDDGWIRSQATGIALRSTGGGKIALRFADDASTERHVPED
jgi:Uma2 family endonuclease